MAMCIPGKSHELKILMCAENINKALKGPAHWQGTLSQSCSKQERRSRELNSPMPLFLTKMQKMRPKKKRKLNLKSQQSKNTVFSALGRSGLLCAVVSSQNVHSNFCHVLSKLRIST